METTQEQKPVDRWQLHPDDIAARYATVFSQRNNYEIGSQTYFEVLHEVQQRIATGIASGRLKLRTWPGRFVIDPPSTISNTTLVDLQDFCESAEDLGVDCPKNACDLAQIFRLSSNVPAPVSALATPSMSTDIPQKLPLPDRASSALGNGKVWTPERLAEMAAYRDQHGTKKTAEHFKISEQRVRHLLPRKKKSILPGYSAFSQCKK